MCECITWGRDYAEMAANPTIPSSEHHPNCKEYKLVHFQRLIIPLCGIRIIDTPEKISQYKPIEPDEFDYTIEDVFITQDQFEKLPEFDG